jgi:hypothetical protein
MFTTLTTFGTPLDVTLAELAVELFYPADDGNSDCSAVTYAPGVTAATGTAPARESRLFP